MQFNQNIQTTKRPEFGRLVKWLHTGIVMLFLINVQSCNFPEDAKTEMMFETPTVYHFETGSTGGTVSYFFGEDYRYQVVLAPKWIMLESIEGRTKNGEINIPFVFSNLPDYIGQEGSVSGNLVVRIGNIGLFTFPVSYGKNIDPNPGTNQLAMICNVAYLNFGSEEKMSFTLTNPDSYGNSWQALDVPQWLQLSANSGYLGGGEQVTIQCSLQKEDLALGNYSHHINIVSSNPQSSHGILVTMTVDNSGPVASQKNTKWIEGKVKDAYFCTASGNLYVLTQKPNKLLYQLPESDSLYAIPLSKMPNCMDVSADGKTLVVGYNQAVVDVFDTELFEVKRSYETDCVPSDIVLGENDWCYITPETDQWVYLYSLNMTTGVTHRSSSHGSIYEKTRMVKAPDKALLYATRPQLSPGGVLVINIADGAAKDTIPSWHIDTGGNIWITKDGKKLIAANKKIYKTPEYTTELYNLDLPIVGSLDVPRNYLKSLNYCESLNCYFAVGSDYYWAAYNAETIYQLDDVSYSAVKSVKVQAYPGPLSNLYNPLMSVHHAFVNKQGTKLFALKNVPYELEMDKWALERIDLPLK